MDRSRRLALLASVVAPLLARAQPTTHRIGFLATSGAANLSSYVDAFRRGLRDHGYAEGSVAIEFRYAEGRHDRLPQLARELVNAKASAIVTEGTVATQAAAKATSSIPIVMALVGDPVTTGLVKTLARPGANITGLTTLSLDLLGKQLELLKAIVPELSRVCVIGNPGHPGHARALTRMRAAAQVLQIEPEVVQARTAADLEGTFSMLAQRRPPALTWVSSPEYDSVQARMAAFTMQARIPAIYSKTAFPEAGGLMSYGADFPDLFHRAAGYVDKLLRGARAADLPVEQPSKFELIVNMRSARALGLSVPNFVLIGADRVID